LNFRAAELLIIIRVCSLYGNRKLLIWCLRGVLCLALIAAIVVQILFGRAYRIALYYEFLPGCWTWSPKAATVTQWPMWITFLGVEGVLMLLTAYNLLSYRTQMNQKINVLARDSIAYAIIVFACLAFLSSHDLRNLPINPQLATECVTSIAVGRMMMNIRGLILDDPEHTVHLKTLQFATNPNSVSEI